MEKRIRISCSASRLVPLNDLTPFQGELKSLSKIDFEKLKTSILRYGISFPFFVYESEGTNFVLDGHQRDRVLHSLRDEGYEIPDLPVDFIEAKDEREAKDKILLLSSQYGKINEENLYLFLNENDLDFPNLKEVLDLPKIDLERFEKGWMKEETPPGVKSSYQVIVFCDTLSKQTELFERLVTEGYHCKASHRQKAIKDPT